VNVFIVVVIKESTRLEKRRKMMNRSCLIQRLKKPLVIREENKDTPLAKLAMANPFAFGGGLVNGGLSKEAMEVLRKIFSFDYMGAAEFEWGAVPEALGIIVAPENLKKTVAFEVEIPWSVKEWNEKTNRRRTKKGKGIVYIICQKEWREEVIDRIQHYAKDDQGYYGKGECRTHERVRLQDTLSGNEYGDCVGWLELDNGYMFFTDEEMFKKTCTLLGLKEAK